MPKVPEGKIRLELLVEPEARDALREVAQANRRTLQAQFTVMVLAARDAMEPTPKPARA